MQVGGKINYRLRNKRRNLWVGWCVSSWWPWFPSRSSVLIYIFLCICMPYMSSVIGRIYIYIYIYTTGVSFSIGEAAPYHVLLDCISGECAVPGLNDTFCFLWLTNCVLLNTLILGIWCFTIPHLPGCFLSLDLLSEYRIQHGANGPLDVTSSYSTWIFCRGVSGFAIVLATFGVVD